MEENTVPVTIRFSEDFFSRLKSEAFEKKESVATIVYNRLLYSYKQNSIQDKLDNIERKMEELILKQDVENFLLKYNKRQVAIWGAGHQSLATISLLEINLPYSNFTLSNLR